MVNRMFSDFLHIITTEFNNDIKIQAEQHRVVENTINPYYGCLTSKVKGRSLQFLMHGHSLPCRKRMCWALKVRRLTQPQRDVQHVLAGHLSLVSLVTRSLLILLYSNPILATGANLLVRQKSCIRLLLMRPSD